MIEKNVEKKKTIEKKKIKVTFHQLLNFFNEKNKKIEVFVKKQNYQLLEKIIQEVVKQKKKN